MGTDAGDFDNDGDEDVIVTELTGQGTNLFVNDGTAHFRDASAASGIGVPSQPYTGWGTAWFDYDNDGWLDLLAVNGTIIAQEGRTGRAFPYDQKKLLFRNLANGRFEIRRRAGRPGVRALGIRPRRGVRRYRQRRRHRRARRQQQRSGAVCSSTRSARASTGSACVSSGAMAATCSARACRWRAQGSRRCGGAPGPMAATGRPTIHACSWASARRPWRRRCACAGPTAARRRGPRCPPTRWTTLRQGTGQ